MIEKQNWIKINLWLLIVISVSILLSCSVKKDRFLNRTYHKVTSHYNAYFNGKEALKEGKYNLEKAHKDNYLKILPVFKYGSEQDAQSVAGNMDKAITKASLVIKRHSMNINKKERNKWIPESYLLIGKANFYKQNYQGAKETFEYVLMSYKKTQAAYEANIWLARTYNQMHKFEKSQPQLDLIKNKIERTGGEPNLVQRFLRHFKKNEMPMEVYKDMPMVYSDFYIQQDNYMPAIEHLKRAIDVNHKKKTRARLTFILAQIYQSNGELAKATKYYRKVLKLNPKYDMAFNTKMNLARCYDVSNPNSKGIKKDLLKMAKDIRNKDFLDQIYYALAEIELREKNVPEALKYLKMSAAASTNNPNQKAITFLKIADLYFEREDFINSAMYYDSTMTLLPKDWPKYTELTEKKNTLDDLAKNLLTIKTEDSLQTLAKMPESERDKIIQKMIDDFKKKEEEKKQAELNRQINMAYYNSGYGNQYNQYGQQGVQGANWYFYNQNTVKFGISDFIRKWGNRPLEDNWRLSNKQKIDFGNMTAGGMSKADSLKEDSIKKALAEFNPKDKNSYLKKLPLTPEKMKKSNEKVEEALYAAGFIFREGLHFYKQSAEEFEELAKRYPESKYLLSSYYQLYTLYDDELHNQSKADYYKDLILTKYGETDYAKMVQDPEYIKHMSTKRNEAAALYKDTYDAYLDAKYDLVIENSNNAITKYKGNDLLPKFSLIKALSIGKTSDLEAFKTSLNEVVSKYPNSKAKAEAQDILNYIGKKDSKTGDKTKGKPGELKKEEGVYEANADALHLYIMLLDAKDASMKDIKIAVSDFNTKNFSLTKLSISSTYLNSTQQIITVTNFENQDAAMHYYRTIKDDKNVNASIKKAKIQQYIITTDNYTTLMKKKDFSNYGKFFKEAYLK